MKYPNFEEEKILWKKGFKFVAGVDEAGRGPLAGPVVAAAVIFNFQFPCPSDRRASSNKFLINQFSNIKDSKQLSAKQREKIYLFITKHPQIKWGIGVVSEKVIDKINILEATKLAMLRAVDDIDCNVDYLILDGNFKVDASRLHFLSSCPWLDEVGSRIGEVGEPKQKSIVKGDQKVFSCAAASIIAKVTRDGLMQKLHQKHPQYGFNKHKGYCTDLHVKMLKKFGPCPIHRKTFFPVSEFFAN
jgi:ribonuclease HII